MKVSIITATYNSVNTIEKCMESVLSQSYPNIEYIIIDGKSNDGTLEKIQELSQNASNVVIISEKDKGIYDALNKGIDNSTGDIVGFVHSDDFLADKDCISQIVERFKAFEADGVYGDLHYVSFNDPENIVRNWKSENFTPQLLRQGWMPAHPTLYLKKELYNQHGRFNLDYKIAADYDFILRIFKESNYNFHYLPKTIVKMRIGGASNKSLKNIIQKTKEDYRAVKSNNTGNVLTVFLKNVSKIKQFKT